MDDRLALEVVHADQSTTRWGFDQPAAQDIPGDLTFAKSLPGMDKDLSCSLLRDLRADNTDQALLGRVRAYGPGGRTAWNGRFQRFPRDQQQVTPGAVGMSAHMLDFPGFREVYVDRDLGHWGDLPLERRVALSVAAISYGDFSYANALGGLTCALPNQALGTKTMANRWYSAPPGCKISYLKYRGQATGLPGGWEVAFFNADASDGSGGTLNAATFDNTLRTITFATARRYIDHWTYSNSTASTPAAGASTRLDKLAAYGNHGLQNYSIAGEPDGFYGHDLIANIVSRCCPLLTVTQGPGGVEPNTSFVIPQAAFTDPTTADAAVGQINAYYQWEWGVDSADRFFWRQPDPYRLTWTARSDRGDRVTWEGEDGDQQFNGVIVQYTDAEGRSRTAGPPAANWPGGTPIADVTNTVLVDTSSTNPVNAQGIPQRWGILSVGFPTTDDGAVQLGYVWLALHSIPQRRGTIVFQGSAEHPTEGEVPAWRPQPGDGVKIGSVSGDVPRRIIDTTYRHQNRELVAAVGDVDTKLSAILERVGVQLVGVIS